MSDHKSTTEQRELMEDFGPILWIEALEDATRYTHGQEALGIVYKPDAPVRACCLGVLAHAAGAANLSPHSGSYASVIEVDNSASTLGDARPSWLASSLADRLMEVNDWHDTKDFSRQIKIIRKEVVPVWEASKVG